MASGPAPLGHCALILCILLSACSSACDAVRSQRSSSAPVGPYLQSWVSPEGHSDQPQTEAFYEEQAQRNAELLGHEVITEDHPYRLVPLSEFKHLAEEGGAEGASFKTGDALPLNLLKQLARPEVQGDKPTVPVEGGLGRVRSLLGPRRHLGEGQAQAEAKSSASENQQGGGSSSNQASQPSEKQASGGSVEKASENSQKEFQGSEGKESQGSQGSEGGSSTPACDSELRRKLRSKLGNVVMVLNFNYRWVAENTGAFWRRVYSPIFRDVVMVGSNPWPELGVEPRGPRPWRWEWKFQYWCLSKIMARYPDADGFLWTNDDVMLSYWKLLEADTTKLWMPNDPHSKETRRFKYELVQDGKNEESATADGKLRLRQAYEMMDEAYRKQLDASSGEYKDCFQKRIADLFYVPKRFVESFAYDLVPVFREARAHSEAAVPTMFYALDHPDNWDHVLDDMVYRWDLYDSRDWKRKSYRPENAWNPNISALHPWKVANAEGKKVLLHGLNQVDTCVCHDLADLC